MALNINLDEAKLADLAEQLRERRREREELNEEVRCWKRSEERYTAKREAEHRKAWAAFHLSQAENLERTAVELAASHRARAQKLLGEEC